MTEAIDRNGLMTFGVEQRSRTVGHIGHNIVPRTGYLLVAKEKLLFVHNCTLLILKLI